MAAAILALVMAPIAAQALEPAQPNPKLPIAGSTESLLLKNAVVEQRMTYACMLGRAGGTALYMLLGSGSAWDALTDALSGLPLSAEQRAFCALGEALAPHVAAAAEGISQEAWSATREMMDAGSAQIGQAWAKLRDTTTETGSDLVRLCEASSSCAPLRDSLAHAWSRLWPTR